MKSAVVLAAAASAVLVNAQPHGHQHYHHAKRVPTAVDVVSDASETAFAFVLNGETVSQNTVCEGIADGSLVWDGSKPEGACESASSISTSAPAATSTTSSSSSASAAQFYEQTSSSSAVPTSSAVASSSSQAASSSSSSASSSSSSGTSDSSVSYDTSGFSNFTSAAAQSSYPDFEDGVYSCSDGPPTSHGAVVVSWTTTQGWTGVQLVNSDGSLNGDATECTDGAYCSYACAPGWQKYQWPSDQPSDGASLGGLLCKGGLLYKANENAQLCSQGSGDVEIQNKAGSGFSVCRTDYPGTESETVPLYVPSGSTEPLTCPVESDYYVHEGSSTSAQYYLNPIGVTPPNACSWDGQGDGKTGNWAPIVLGVGNTGGTNWLSIQQNTPTSYAQYEGTVEIVGDSCSGTCKYSNGQYCLNGGSCAPNTQNGAGCTVSCSGEATFVVSS